MSDEITKRMLNAYIEEAPSLDFLSSFFQSPPKNFHNSETIEFDIVRSKLDKAVAVEDLSTGYRENSADIYTNKEFKPPIFKESVPLNSKDLLKREPGRTSFDDPMFRGVVISRFLLGLRLVSEKIFRAIEEQAAQVLQTGKIILKDTNDASIYEIDFKFNPTHLQTVTTPWSSNSSNKIQDINNLARVILTDHKSKPTDLIFGETAWEQFIEDNDVEKRFNLRRVDLGIIGHIQERPGGGEYRGTVDIGNYSLNVWSYAGQYRDSFSGNTEPFVNTNKVICLDSNARLDATFGSCPNIGREVGPQSSKLIPELPRRLYDPKRRIDLYIHIWLSPDGDKLYGGVGTRPLMIPTAIDSIACLTTVTNDDSVEKEMDKYKVLKDVSINGDDTAYAKGQTITSSEVDPEQLEKMIKDKSIKKIENFKKK